MYQGRLEEHSTRAPLTLAPMLPTSIVGGVLAVCGDVFLSHDVLNGWFLGDFDGAKYRFVWGFGATLVIAVLIWQRPVVGVGDDILIKDYWRYAEAARNIEEWCRAGREGEPVLGSVPIENGRPAGKHSQMMYLPPSDRVPKWRIQPFAMFWLPFCFVGIPIILANTGLS